MSAGSEEDGLTSVDAKGGNGNTKKTSKRKLLSFHGLRSHLKEK